RAVAESLLGFTTRSFDSVINFTLGAHDAHAFSAATRRGFDQNRETDFERSRAQGFGALIFAVVTWDDRRAGFRRQHARGAFQPHRTNRGGRRADEDDACR